MMMTGIILVIEKRRKEVRVKDMKYSRQRAAILDALSDRHDHPTAETLYGELRQADPHLSLGTVYRNLNMLAERGIISRFDPGDGMIRFDPRADRHYHFRCLSCGRVSDLEMKPSDKLDRMAEEEGIGRVESHMLVFSGQCRDCAGHRKP